MRWHGFGKVNSKGLQQRPADLGHTLANQGSVPAEIVGRDRWARSSGERAKVQSIHAELARAASNAMPTTACGWRSAAGRQGSAIRMLFCCGRGPSFGACASFTDSNRLRDAARPIVLKLKPHCNGLPCHGRLASGSLGPVRSPFLVEASIAGSSVAVLRRQPATNGWAQSACQSDSNHEPSTSKIGPSRSSRNRRTPKRPAEPCRGMRREALNGLPAGRHLGGWKPRTGNPARKVLKVDGKLAGRRKPTSLGDELPGGPIPLPF
jgi:hypothetical protein